MTGDDEDYRDLVAFVEARLVDDEQAAIAVQHWAGVRVESATGAEAAHIARHDPARVLADVAAHRVILAELTEQDGDGTSGASTALRAVVALAGVWRDHSDCPPWARELMGS